MSYKHFNIETRSCIAYSLKNMKSIREISKILNCSHSSISREIKRNSKNGIYNPAIAEKLSKERSKNCGSKGKLTLELKEEISKRLKKHHSPEQISGRLIKEKYISKLSFKSIYNWISKGLIPEINKLNLRRKGKRSKESETRGKIGGTNISERPLKVELRKELGHWEGDTILGEGRILTLVERVSRFTYIFKLEGKVSESVKEKIKKLRKMLPKKLLKSITFDNGKEFSKHRGINLETLIEIYFANPGNPHERGTNENTNGLLREYFPKGRNLKKVDNTELSEVLLELNTRPRKCLNYNTPLEILQSYL
jgi:transposase, IS30 family